MKQINFKLLNLFLILYPWGRFFDAVAFGSLDAGERGITTILFAFIILKGIYDGTFFIGLNMVLNRASLGIFLLLTLLGTLLSNSPEKIFSDFINLLFYFLMVFNVVGLRLSSKQVEKSVNLLLLSTAIMSFVSLLDFVKIINVPFMNEGISNVQQGGVVVFDLTGPFRIRTEISFHLALAMVLPVIFLLRKFTIVRVFYYSSFLIVLLITSFFTNSRSIYLSFIVGLVYLLVVFRQLPQAKILFRTILLSAILIVLFYHQTILQVLETSALMNRQLGGESDLTRWYAFRATLIDVVFHPYGAGLDRPFIKELDGYKDVHNSYTYLLRAGGFLGLGCLFIFMRPIIKKLVSLKISPNESVSYIPVLSIMIFGFFHTSIQISSFWILVGFCLSMANTSIQRQVV